MSLVDYSDTDNEDLLPDNLMDTAVNNMEENNRPIQIWASPVVAEEVHQPTENMFANNLLINLCRNLGPPNKLPPTRKNSSLTELRNSLSPPRPMINTFKNADLDHDLEYSGGPFFSYSELKPNKYTEKARNTSSVKAVKNFNIRTGMKPIDDYNSSFSDYESDTRGFETDDFEETASAIRKRKNHISYLAYEAKKNEEKFKNEWAANRMTRKQTQARYGF